MNFKTFVKVHFYGLNVCSCFIIIVIAYKLIPVTMLQSRNVITDKCNFSSCGTRQSNGYILANSC